ncbi:hypothetical protein CQW23_33002 [Capsicum baccatum]|uniref:Uncharacterized protein n=1 Tax=Capsicum baccatum TaxID=33114 RepID=A0A2G2V330_CAPBA|nr:hypothetical protein CQW23_33002 [Capsicum baccatum]
MKILRWVLRRLRKKEVDGLTPIDWQPFEDLITEVSLAVKKQKEQDLVQELEKSKQEEEMAMPENAKLRKEIEDLNRSLASKEVLASDPDTNLHLGMEQILAKYNDVEGSSDATRAEIMELKRKLALKKDPIEPDTSLCLGIPDNTSQKLITSEVENDVENLMEIE